jgi:hypothetical protein
MRFVSQHLAALFILLLLVIVIILVLWSLTTGNSLIVTISFSLLSFVIGIVIAAHYFSTHQPELMAGEALLHGVSDVVEGGIAKVESKSPNETNAKPAA